MFPHTSGSKISQRHQFHQLEPRGVRSFDVKGKQIKGEKKAIKLLETFEYLKSATTRLYDTEAKIICIVSKKGKHSKKYTLHALWFDCNFAPA